jgi:hypothetical protein
LARENSDSEEDYLPQSPPRTPRKNKFIRKREEEIWGLCGLSVLGAIKSESGKRMSRAKSAKNAK